MTRSIYAVFSLAAFGAALTFATPASAETIPLSGSCSYETSFGCSAQCTPGSINCNVQFIDQCSGGCTATATTSCTTACAKECATTGVSFSCSGYCGGQCDTLCTQNNDYGAASHTQCVTDCQGQCSYQCSAKPVTTCATECATACTTQENIKCGVSCEVKNSASCNITPAMCNASCNGTGGAIVCNGQVVYLATSVTDAAGWYVSHLDAQFSLSAMCSNGVCSLSAGGCAAAPEGGHSTGTGLALACLGFVGFGLVRRRNRRG